MKTERNRKNLLISRCQPFINTRNFSCKAKGTLKTKS